MTPAPKRRRARKLIEAEEFRLVDADGRLLGWLHGRDGDPTLELRNEPERSYVTVKIEDGRPLVNLEYKGVHGVVGIGTSDDGDIGMTIGAIDGKFRIMLRVSRDGNAEILILDKNADAVVWRAPLPQARQT